MIEFPRGPVTLNKQQGGKVSKIYAHRKSNDDYLSAGTTRIRVIVLCRVHSRNHKVLRRSLETACTSPCCCIVRAIALQKPVRNMSLSLIQTSTLKNPERKALRCKPCNNHREKCSPTSQVEQ